MKKLIVNADDFGFSAKRNQGIIETIEKGIVTSVSVLAGLPGAKEAFEFLKGRDVGVGVHLNLSEGPAICSDLKTLTDASGQFLGKEEIQKRAVQNQINPAEVERELLAQVTRVHDTGVTITHMDGHHHLHVFPPVVPSAVQIAKQFGIRWMRCPLLEAGMQIQVSKEKKKALLHYARLGAAARKVFESAKFSFADHFRGAVLVEEVSQNKVEAMLRALPEGVTEYMTHPGYADEDDAFSTSTRPEEVRILTDAKIRHLINDLGIELTHFGKL